MSREEIEKLLGGYATDTLSEAERRALFEAALDDQELFAELAKEQALRELLQDPPARQQLIEVLGPARDPLGARAWRWLRRPAVLAMAGGLAALLIVAGLVLRPPRQVAHKEDLVVAADAIAQPQAPLAATPQARSTVTPQARSAVTPTPKKPALAGGAGETRRKLKRWVQPPEPPVLTGRNQLAAPALPFVEPAPPPALPPPGPARPAASGVPMGQVVGALILQKQARASAPAPNPSVKYSLLLMGADGAYSAAPTDAVFHIGDSAGIQVEPNEAGFLYLFRKNAAGIWNTIAGVAAEKGQQYVLPSGGGIQSASPAHVDLLLVFSRREQAAQMADVDQLTANTGQGVYRIAMEFR